LRTDADIAESTGISLPTSIMARLDPATVDAAREAETAEALADFLAARPCSSISLAAAA
jgi:hypothetical protein